MNTLTLRRSLPRRLPHSAAAVLSAGAAALALTLAGCGSGGHTVPAGQTGVVSTSRFAQTNLVADTAGIAAVTDPNLVNPWGIAFSPTGPFWLADNGPGLSTVYNGSGAIQSLVVTIPAASGGAGGTPSGTVYTGGVSLSGSPAFAFVSEDGVLTTWSGGTNATIASNQSANNAVFKGVALAQSGGNNYLYVTDFHNGQIDVFNSTYQLTTLAGSFSDPSIPAGFAPFNIAAINGNLYVAYAKQDSAKHDDAPGAGNGYVDVFSTSGALLSRLISAGRLDSPWGLQIAPSGFGPYGGDLLVGNFGDGTINVYNPTTGAYLGTLLDTTGNSLVIPGLWGLQFGNGGSGGTAGVLYFTAGPDGENHGLFGSLQAQ